MRSLFPKWVNRLPLVLALSGAAVSVGAVGFVTYYFSPKFTDVGYAPRQPVPYSHKLHAGILGMDCRYCHIGVEVSDHATVPASQTCMNCHKVIRPDSRWLLPVRLSASQDVPVEWVRIHDLPDYVHFNHSVHVTAGVGCVDCHGRIDQMERVHQVEPLSMSWCLDCHRDPAPYIRPPGVSPTDMEYAGTPREEGERLMALRNISPPQNCSACHY